MWTRRGVGRVCVDSENVDRGCRQGSVDTGPPGYTASNTHPNGTHSCDNLLIKVVDFRNVNNFSAVN